MTTPDAPARRRGAQRLPGRDPVWARLLIAVGLVFTLLAGGALAGKEALFKYATRSVAQENLLGDSGRQAEQRGHVDVNGAKNILLIGVDARPGQDPAELVRADSIIILHIPASHDQAYLVSIPRDTWVKIPPYDNGAKRYEGGHDKINGAYAWGGDGLTGAGQRAHAVELLALTIKSLWGITFDGAAIVDFTGFQQVVEVLGGVDMYVDEETTSVHIGHTANGEYAVPFRQFTRSDGGQGLSAVPGVTPQVYHVGYQHLEPWQALDYVRQRELLPNSDYDRQRHQQQFLKALFKKILSSDVLTDPGRLNDVLRVVGKAMTIDSGGIDLADWLYAMRGIGADDLLTIKTNNGTFNNAPGVSNAETLDQTTLDLLEAVRTERVQAFVAGHLDLVAPS
ncbi:LCP family protein [Dactylosporangium sp. NPDC000244]|uniref:LCP family protein n=1 Tax=Dactylosporangium sp. NPDC000244 TaxID=3154365 RepID=UPI00332A0C8C